MPNEFDRSALGRVDRRRAEVIHRIESNLCSLLECMAQLHLQLQAGDSVAGAAGHSHVIEMPQLDATSRSAATDHNHAMEMAPIDNNGRRSSCSAADDKNHVVIDIDGGGRRSTSSDDDTPSCVVCMEPLEWVAVGPCGHRVVCSACTARIRYPPKSDHRCCICRTLCPNVVVTNVAATAADGEPNFSELPVASQDGRVGDYWYRAAMSAYFDNEQQYEAAAKAASLKEHPSASSVADGEHGQHSRMPPFLIYCLYTALLGVAIGLMFAMDATGWGQRVAIVSGSAAVSVAIGSVFWLLAYYSNCG